jgi:hypothetical protein
MTNFTLLNGSHRTGHHHAEIGRAGKPALLILRYKSGHLYSKPRGFDPAQPELPLVGGGAKAGADIPPLPPFEGKATTGFLQTPSWSIPLRSGYDGPAASMPKGSPGLNGRLRSHVEAHAATLMRIHYIREATLYINNPVICAGCMRFLPRMLPPDSVLNVVLPDGRIVRFKGVQR